MFAQAQTVGFSNFRRDTEVATPTVMHSRSYNVYAMNAIYIFG
jgi:hypothetical protein